MNRFIILLVAVATGCTSAPKKDDKTVTEQPAEAPAQTDVLTKPVEDVEVPPAETLDQSDGEIAPAAERVEVPVDSNVASALSDAKSMMGAGNMSGAANVLAGSVDHPDGGFLAAYNLGVVRERQGQYDKAANRYFQALQKNPDFSPALENLVRLYLRNGQAADADQLVNKFTSSRPENLGHRATALQVLLFKQAYEDVIQNAKRILRKDERHVSAMLALAEANYRLGRNELAKSVISGAIALEGDRGELYHLAGLVDLELDDKSGAIANFEAATEKNPNYPEAHNNLGVLYHEARDYAGAIDRFNRALLNYPTFKEAYLNLGNAYKGDGKYKDAETAFKKAIEIDNRFANAHFNLGVLYLDSEVPGFTPSARFQKSIDSLQTYKTVMRNVPKDDPADKYIAEARKSIEVEKQKQEMMREAQQGGGDES